jgi:acyl-coenzyme A thioesterase PaaI-like protein
MTLLLTNPIEPPKHRHLVLRHSLVVGHLRARREALIRTIAHLKRQRKSTAAAQADLQDVVQRLMAVGA